MINRRIIPELNEDIIWKKEGSDGLTISLASYHGGPIRLLNPVASRIIEFIDGSHSVGDIIDHLYSSFEGANLKVVEKDVSDFLKALENKKIINNLSK